MTPSKEYDLIKRCQNGDISAYRVLYDREKVKLFNTALRICGNRQDAEDCIQDSFIKIYRSLSGFKFESSFSTYLYRILVNTCITHRNKYQTDFDELEENRFGTVKNHEFDLTQQLETAVQKLTGNNKHVFVLYEIEGFNHNEISDMLAIPVGTSKSCLSRAKEFLKEQLKEYQHYEF